MARKPKDDKPKKVRAGQQFAFWLIPGNKEHDYLIEFMEWWKTDNQELSDKIRLGLLLLTYVEAGDIDGFLSKIPASFYNQLASRMSPTVIMSTPSSATPVSAPIPNYPPLKNGGIEAVEIDIEEFMSNADDDLDALFE